MKMHTNDQQERVDGLEEEIPNLDHASYILFMKYGMFATTRENVTKTKSRNFRTLKLQWSQYKHYKISLLLKVENTMNILPLNYPILNSIKYIQFYSTKALQTSHILITFANAHDYDVATRHISLFLNFD